MPNPTQPPAQPMKPRQPGVAELIAELHQLRGELHALRGELHKPVGRLANCNMVKAPAVTIAFGIVLGMILWGVLAIVAAFLLTGVIGGVLSQAV